MSASGRKRSVRSGLPGRLNVAVSTKIRFALERHREKLPLLEPLAEEEPLLPNRMVVEFTEYLEA